MTINGYRATALLLGAVALLIAGSLPGVVSATPNANGIVVNERVFNDCPITTLTVTNSYPSSVMIDDANLSCAGYANLHNWHFSEDGGATEAVFNNGDSFRFGADLVISGTAEAEAGLQIAPWWSQDVDGRFNVRTTDGEIACFGGRLPFFSFTGDFGIHYVKGDAIHLEVTYDPQGNSMSNPATITYSLMYNGSSYSSGALPFDEGNPAEGYGSWGMLDDARVGGYVQVFMQNGNTAAEAGAEWSNVEYGVLQVVAVEPATWGEVKARF